MDEQMPIMDGTEAVRNIIKYEKENFLKHTPVSALTANVIKGVKERGLLSGYDAFLGKPIILKDLEIVLSQYLSVTLNEVSEIKQDIVKDKIQGLDITKLKDELMLNEDELMMLLKLFLKKMNKQIPELLEAIKKQDYKKVALLAHSIKGSSGNFRIECLQHNASEIESMAKAENSEYSYEEVLNIMKARVQEIEIT
jgi:CheY-like chemotaxis protein